MRSNMKCGALGQSGVCTEQLQGKTEDVQGVQNGQFFSNVIKVQPLMSKEGWNRQIEPC